MSGTPTVPRPPKELVMPRLRTTVAAATGVLALGAGLGVAGLASAAPTPSPTPSASSTPSAGPSDAPGQRWGGGPGGGHGFRDGGRLAAALAEKLDLEESAVSDGLREYRQANRPASRPDPGTRPAGPDDTALAQSLAEALDQPEADVAKALAEIRSERDTARGQAVEAKLAEAVEAGTLTPAEADAVRKAADAGIVHVGR
ncbi:hypothetical protein GCM10009616_26020 [Microlunatus lacustris]